MLNSEEIKNGQEAIKTPEETKDKDLETVKAEIKSEGEVKSKETINNINEAAEVALESFSDNPELKGDVSKIVSGANNEISSLTEDFENKLERDNLSDRERLLKLSKEDIIQLGSKSVEEMLDQIPDADSEIASKIIDYGLSNFVARNLGKFHNLSEEIITKLMDDKDSRWVVCISADKLGENTRSVLLKLSKEDIIQLGSKSVEEMLNQIPDADSEIASKIIDYGLSNFVARNLGKFHNLSEEIITKLMDDKDSRWAVCISADKLGENTRSVLLKLSKEDIEQVGTKSIAEMLNQIPDADSEIASKFIDEGLGSDLAENLGKFHNLSEEIITKLMDDDGSRRAIWFNTNGLGENTRSVLLKLNKLDIKMIGTKDIVEMLNQIPDADSEIASKFIEEGLGSDVARNLGKFHNLSEEIITKLMDDEGSRRAIWFSTNELGENTRSVLLKLNKLDIKMIGTKDIVEMLNQIPDADSEIASKFIDEGLGSDLAENLGKFHNLSEEIITKLNNLEN